MDDDVAAAIQAAKEDSFEIAKEAISQAQDENSKKFDDVKTVTDELSEKLGDLSNKANETSEKLTAIQDYLRILANTLLATPPGSPIVAPPPPW